MSNVKSFTSQKLDLMNAINADIDLTMSDRVVAHQLLSHANSDTWAIFPSQQRIAFEVGLKVRAVKQCIANLNKVGWIRIERANRHQSNRYAFDMTRVAKIRDRLAMIASELAAMRGSRMPLPIPSEVQSDAPEMGIAPPLQTCTAPPYNTLRLSPEGNDLYQAGVEVEVLSLEPVVSIEGQPAGAVAPHNASKPAGESQAPVLTSSLLNSRIVRQVTDPTANLDRIERQGRWGRG